MPEYRKGEASPVPHKSTKYDGFKLVKTETPYRQQKGSGRSACFAIARDGMTIGTWCKNLAEKGAGDGKYYSASFAIGSLIKLAGTDNPGWIFSDKDDKGQTLLDIKKKRDVDPAKAAARSAKAKTAADAKAAKATKTKAKGDAKATKAGKTKPIQAKGAKGKGARKAA